MWQGRGSGKVKRVRTGGGFLDRQGVQKENRKGISGHGWTGAGRKHAGEGGGEQAPSLTARSQKSASFPSLSPTVLCFLPVSVMPLPVSSR